MIKSMLIKDGILPLIPNDGCDSPDQPCVKKELISTCLDQKPNSTFVFLPLFLANDTLKVPFEAIKPAEFADLPAMLTDINAEERFKVLGMPQGQMDGIAERDQIKTAMKDLINGNNVPLWWDTVRQKMESLIGLNIMCYEADKDKMNNVAQALPNIVALITNLKDQLPILKTAATEDLPKFDV